MLKIDTNSKSIGLGTKKILASKKNGCKVYSSPKKNGVMIGYYRKLSFRSNNGEETVGQWTMNEYSIRPEAFPEIQGLDWVICRIKRDDTKSSVGGKVSNKRKGNGKSIMNSSPNQASASVSEELVPVPKKPRLDNEDEAGCDAAEFVEGPGERETSYGEWEEIQDVGLTFDVDEFLNSLNQVL